MKQPVRVVLKDGSEISLYEWQRLYDLIPDGDLLCSRIGKYFKLTEYRFRKDIELFGQLIVNELLMRVLDAFREEVNQPVSINSFNRSQAHQDELKKKGFKTAVYSPHVVKLAADIETVNDTQSLQFVAALKKVSKALKIKIRIGYKEYMQLKQTFVHVDVCPEYYGPGKPYHNIPHPKVWEHEVTW